MAENIVSARLAGGYPSGAVAPAAAGVRAMGALRAKIESLNRMANLISEDASGISIEIDRISGCVPCDPSKSAGERPESCDLDAFQSQLDRLDRLAQFVRSQLDRMRSL